MRCESLPHSISTQQIRSWESIPNSGTPQSSRLVQTAPEYQKNCIRQSTNTVSTHGPAEQPTLKQKRFRWTPISSSTPATQILRSCVPTDTENPIDVESAREQVGEYASRTADDSILESEAKYGSDSGLVQTPRPFNEIALAVTKTKNKCDSAVSDRAEVICTPQDSFNGEEKVNDVWFSHNDSTAAHPEMNFEEGFLEWERETQTPPLTQQRPPWEQKDRSTDIDQDRTRSDSADSCADAFCRSEMKVKSTDPLPLRWKTRVDFTDVSLRPEMNRYTTATFSTNTSSRRSYETPPGPPRFRFDVTQKGSADTIGQNVTTSGIDRERSIPDTPCNQSTLVHSVYESKIPENVRFRSTLTRRADGDQNQRLDLDVGLIESGWEELACWIYVMEVCKIHEDNRTISEMTEHTPRLETPSSTTRIMNWQTLSGRIGVDKVQHFQVDCSREDALALKSNGIQVDMDERPSYPEACEE
ncbi:unnamed protein product [Dicrocoelium dendriticum]|nr:unnamed protein product [Dicrocoelium dendriticum]